jgi:hypothetical protein
VTEERFILQEFDHALLFATERIAPGTGVQAPLPIFYSNAVKLVTRIPALLTPLNRWLNLAVSEATLRVSKVTCQLFPVQALVAAFHAAHLAAVQTELLKAVNGPIEFPNAVANTLPVAEKVGVPGRVFALTVAL